MQYEQCDDTIGRQYVKVAAEVIRNAMLGPQRGQSGQRSEKETPPPLYCELS